MMNFDEIVCRLTSIINYITSNEGKYFVLDDEKNMYYRGKKHKAKKSTEFKDFEKEGHALEGINNSVRFYIKKV